MATNWMFYRVGCVNKGEIKWGNPFSSCLPQKTFYGAGSNPQVSLNDHNVVVEVHKGQYMNRCFYRVGKVDLSTNSIHWHSSIYLNVGLHPVVALNNKGTVVSVFQDNMFTKHLNYRVGQTNSRMGVNWHLKYKQKARVNNAVVFSVDINDNDIVVLSHQNPLYHIHYKIGHIVRGTINWSNNIHKSTGFTPSISINNINQVVLFHQSLARRHLMSSVGVARFDGEIKGIIWSEKGGASSQDCGKGLYPSASLNDHGQVVEVHEPRLAPARNRLYYFVGELKY